MRIRALALVLVPFAALPAESAARQDSSIPELGKCLATIQGKDVEATLELLTSNRFAGRDTPQRGLYRAIEHVEKAFEAAKLEPLGSAGAGYRHEYMLPVTDAADSSTLEIDAGQGSFQALVLRDDFIPARASGSAAAEGELVFAGFGIEAPDFRWNDYSKVDVKGKIAVVLTGEPRQDRNEKKFFEGLEMTEHSGIAKKAALAAEKGAKALLVVAPSVDEADLWLGCQLPIAKSGQGSAAARSGQGDKIPVAIVAGPSLQKILNIDFVAKRTALDQRRGSDSKSLAPARAKLNLEVVDKTLPVHNVVARFPARPGSPRASEVVVVGAHLDHVGVDDRGRVHPGADDNAGGTAAVLEIAQALAAVAPFTDRAIVVMSFTGEEKGLLGSHAFAQNPTVPVDSMYAMINLDIIARGRPKAIEATQSKDPTLLTRLLPTAVRLSGTSFKVGDGGKQFFERSDHFEFYKVGVPTIFFNEGETCADYHKWTDSAEKALPNKVAAVAKIAFVLACLAANSDLEGRKK